MGLPKGCWWGEDQWEEAREEEAWCWSGREQVGGLDKTPQTECLPFINHLLLSALLLTCLIFSNRKGFLFIFKPNFRCKGCHPPKIRFIFEHWTTTLSSDQKLSSMAIASSKLCKFIVMRLRSVKLNSFNKIEDAKYCSIVQLCPQRDGKERQPTLLMQSLATRK